MAHLDGDLVGNELRDDNGDEIGKGSGKRMAIDLVAKVRYEIGDLSRRGLGGERGSGGERGRRLNLIRASNWDPNWD